MLMNLMIFETPCKFLHEVKIYFHLIILFILCITILRSLNLFFNSIEWEDEDQTWNPDMSTQAVSSSEEDVTKEVDSDDDSDDLDFRPRICIR